MHRYDDGGLEEGEVERLHSELKDRVVRGVKRREPKTLWDTQRNFHSFILDRVQWDQSRVSEQWEVAERNSLWRG